MVVKKNVGNTKKSAKRKTVSKVNNKVKSKILKKSSVSKQKKVVKKSKAKSSVKAKTKPKSKAKSRTVKKSIKKKISPKQYFYLQDGSVLKSIEDLARLMDGFDDELFNYHVNDERHDFANWINDVFDEANLANELLNCEKHKEKNHYIILKFVVKNN